MALEQKDSVLSTLHQGVGRAWRTLATLAAFASFGLGGMLLWLLVFPSLHLLVLDARRRQTIARGLVQKLFRLFVSWMRLLGLLTYEIRGEERLKRQGLLILANHPTLIDVVFLIGMVRNADCVVKSGLATNLSTRGAVRATGYISNTQGGELIQSCAGSLSRGGNLVIFPEGTRTRLGEPLRLQRGAAQIALRAHTDITPVFIRCEPAGLMKGQPWWQIASQRLHFTICVGEDIAIAPFAVGSGGETALAARRLTEYLTEYFSKKRGWDASVRTRDQATAD